MPRLPPPSLACACALLVHLACGGGDPQSIAVPAPGAAGRGGADSGARGWTSLAPGLEVARLPAPSARDAVITVVRVDPARWRFSLLSAKLRGLDPAPTVSEWVERHGVTGAINASMYQEDGRTAVGYMREGGRLNNGHWNRHQAVFVAEPERGGPPAQILDRTCQDARGQAARYQVVVQSIRMIDCRGRNVWQAQPRRWSTAAIGADAGGRVLLVHCRTPLPAHELVDALLALPLQLRRLMYVEGGAEAALHVRVNGRTEVSELGTFAEGGLLGQAARLALPLPNAIGFAPR